MRHLYALPRVPCVSLFHLCGQTPRTSAAQKVPRLLTSTRGRRTPFQEQPTVSPALVQYRAVRQPCAIAWHIRVLPVAVRAALPMLLVPDFPSNVTESRPILDILCAATGSGKGN